jgi:hypothetical protein
MANSEKMADLAWAAKLGQKLLESRTIVICGENDS